MFDASGTTLRAVIEFAYDLKSSDQLVGATGWMTTDKFDIKDKTDEAQAAALNKLPRDQQTKEVRLMLQALLVERCKLKVHFETKEMPIYELVVAKGGPKLTATVMAPADAENSAPHPVKGPMIQMMGPGKLKAIGVSTAMTADVLSRQPELGSRGSFSSGRMVVDKTGLAGSYDWSLDWTPDNIDSASADANKPGLFTALQEQLGLKLQPAKDPVEVIVIDHIELPSENIAAAERWPQNKIRNTASNHALR